MLNLSRTLQSRLASLTLSADPYYGLDIPSPADFGLPEQYTEWRKWQYATVERILGSTKRFFGLCMPCGSGKSLCGVAAAILGGKRTVILTSTLGLQSQISNDFSDISIDIRGMSNYPCVIATSLGLNVDTNVSEAPCQLGYKCSLRFSGGCDYYDRYREAQRSQIITTNYQCWLWDGMKEKGSLHIPRADYDHNKEMGNGTDDPRLPVDMLICDECDLAEDELARFVSVDISRRESLHLGLIWPDAGHGIDAWKQWADENLPDVESRLKGIEKRLEIKNTGERSWSKDLKALRDMKRKLSKLSGMRVEDEWVLQETDGDDKYGVKRGEKIVNLKSVTFSPLAPARYAESALWRGVEKVVLMSATVRPKTLELLGIDESDIEFIEFPSTFPVERRPVIFVPSIQMNYRNEQDDRKMLAWLGRLDQLIGDRLDRKGVVHTTSYKRSQFIFDNSEHRKYMAMHNSRDKERVIEEFKNAEPPCILLSPSVTTGFDFEGDIARYQIIAKLPFLSTQDKLVKARQERDKEYGMFLVAQTMVQCTGRGMRSKDDWCETFILDDSWLWAFRRIRPFVPEDWLSSLRQVEYPPRPIHF